MKKAAGLLFSSVRLAQIIKVFVLSKNILILKYETMEPLLYILQIMHPHPSQVICYLLLSEILQALLESKTGICNADRKFIVCGIK